MSGDKNENKVVFATSLPSYQCPVLNNTNYTLWALRMKKILMANGVWDLVEGTSTSKEIDVKKDSSASAYLFQGLPEDLQMQVAGCETAKEIWDSLKARFIGTEDVQQAHSQQLKSEFERLVMKEDETIDSFAGKLMSIITKAATCGLTFDEQTKVRKLLNAVPDKFVPVVATIEMIVDFKTVKLEEIIGKLKTYEERLKFRKGSEEDNSEKLLFTRQGNDRNYERNYGNDRRGGGNQTRGRGQGRFARDNKNKDKKKKQTLCSKMTNQLVTSKDEKEITSLKEEKRRNEIVIEKDEIPKEKSEDLRSEIEIDLKSKLEFWKFEMLQELEMEKQEFEKKIRNREMAFEKQMQRELENLKKLRDCTSKRMKELKSEREQFEKENHGVISDKKLLEEERVDNGECKKHRETPSRLQKESQIEKDKKVESEDRDTRNSVLEIQEYETIQMKKDDKDDEDEIKDKEDRRPIKEKIQDIFSIEDQDKRSGNKPKFKEQDLLQSVQDKDDEA
ncbi:hypothetical protein Tco_0733548 [Tanacetum coccineum]